MSELLLMRRDIAIDRVKVRAARGGEENSPLIVSIPRTIAMTAKLEIGEYLKIYTDGKKICLEREEVPDL